MAPVWTVMSDSLTNCIQTTTVTKEKEKKKSEMVGQAIKRGT